MASFEWPLVSTISQEFIKPSTPTPYTHKFHKLSTLDQSLSHTYIPLVFFYSKDSVSEVSPTEIYDRLARSLSRHLVSYYPYAGRLRDNATVECNDDGAKFLRVKINASMVEVMYHPNSDIRDLIFRPGLAWANDSPDHSDQGILLVVQLTYFSCGGIAISACLSHKIGDGSSVFHFLSDWAATTRGDIKSGNENPYYVQDSIFPSSTLEKYGLAVSPAVWPKLDGCKQNRYVFSLSKLNALKAYVAGKSGVKNPTRTEVASALLFKCAVAAQFKVTGTSFRETTMLQNADLRELISLKLPSKSIGNLLSYIKVTISDEGYMNLPKIIALFRKGKENFKNKDPVKDNEWNSFIIESTTKGNELVNLEDNEYAFTSLVKPFDKNADFGWGSYMSFVTAKGPSAKYVFLFIHANQIEAFVTLKEEHMHVFELDPELLHFAAPFPFKGPEKGSTQCRL